MLVAGAIFMGLKLGALLLEYYSFQIETIPASTFTPTPIWTARPASKLAVGHEITVSKGDFIWAWVPNYGIWVKGTVNEVNPPQITMENARFVWEQDELVSRVWNMRRKDTGSVLFVAEQNDDNTLTLLISYPAWVAKNEMPHATPTPTPLYTESGFVCQGYEGNPWIQVLVKGDVPSQYDGIWIVLIQGDKKWIVARNVGGVSFQNGFSQTEDDKVISILNGTYDVVLMQTASNTPVEKVLKEGVEISKNTFSIDCSNFATPTP